MLLLNRELVSGAKLYLVSVFQDLVKDCPKIRNLPTIFLRSFKNVAPAPHPDKIDEKHFGLVKFLLGNDIQDLIHKLITVGMKGRLSLHTGSMSNTSTHHST